ncbi:hypothetical protein AMTRI_Chr13g122420 [Amborella trichopoda]
MVLRCLPSIHLGIVDVQFLLEDLSSLHSFSHQARMLLFWEQRKRWPHMQQDSFHNYRVFPKGLLYCDNNTRESSKTFSTKARTSNGEKQTSCNNKVNSPSHNLLALEVVASFA